VPGYEQRSRPCLQSPDHPGYGWRLPYRVSRTMSGSTSAEKGLLLYPECHDRLHRLGFLYPNCVSFQEAFAALEPDDGKLLRPVLRGPQQWGPATRSVTVKLVEFGPSKAWVG